MDSMRFYFKWSLLLVASLAVSGTYIAIGLLIGQRAAFFSVLLPLVVGANVWAIRYRRTKIRDSNWDTTKHLPKVVDGPVQA
jgi:hypothetical protein